MGNIFSSIFNSSTRLVWKETIEKKEEGKVKMENQDNNVQDDRIAVRNEPVVTRNKKEVKKVEVGMSEAEARRFRDEIMKRMDNKNGGRITCDCTAMCDDGF